MSTSIVPVSSLTNNLTSVVEGFENQTIKPSQIMLVQQGSVGAGDTLQVGKLFDKLSGTHFAKMTVVPLAVRHGRVFFPPDKNVGGTPLCRSNDGIFPAPNVPQKQAPKCDVCAHGPRAWRTFKQTGVKPDCDETISLLCIDRETGFPHYLSIKGTSIKSFKAVEEAIFRDIIMGRTKGLDLKRYSYSYDIVPTRVAGSKGNYYVLSFMNKVRIADPEEYGALYQMFVKDQESSRSEDNTESIIDAEVDDVHTEYIEA